MSGRNFDKVVEGGYYRRRGGDVVGPVYKENGGEWPWKVVGQCATYRDDGTWEVVKGFESDLDLIQRVNPDGTPWVESTPGPQVQPVEAVDHPPHYTSHPSGVECIDITEHCNFCVGNAIKYLWRAGQKGDPTVDLQKARWYIDREIKRLGGE